MPAKRVGSLFTGIGGFDLGLERAGMQVAWQCESDDYCRRVLAHHWPDVPCYPDIRELRGTDVEPVDVLCGGFPCQDISLAGKGAGIDGARSGLWAHYARLIRELSPAYVLVENVPALLARGLGRVLADLAASGYDAEWDCLPAAAFGAPHRRDRVWLLAYPGRGSVQRRRDAGELLRPAREAEGEGDQRQRRGRTSGSRSAGRPELARALADPARHAQAGPAAQPGPVGQRARPGGQPGREDPDADRRRREVERLAQPPRLQSAPGRVPDGLRDQRRLDDSAPLADADRERQQGTVAESAARWFAEPGRDGHVADAPGGGRPRRPQRPGGGSAGARRGGRPRDAADPRAPERRESRPHTGHRCQHGCAIGTCIYCGLDAGDYDEHEECWQRSAEEAVADPEVESLGPGLCEGEPGGERRGRPGDSGGEGDAPDASSDGRRPAQPRRPDRVREGTAELASPWPPDGRPGDGASWWRAEPDVGRVADGVPARVDRLRALGNALVPQIAEALGRGVLTWEASQR